MSEGVNRHPLLTFFYQPVQDQHGKLKAKVTDLLRKASKQVFPAAFEALAWIEMVAKTALDNGAISHSWTTPTGDRIEHVEHLPAEAIRVQTHFLVKISIGLGKLKLPNTTKLTSGLSPC